MSYANFIVEKSTIREMVIFVSLIQVNPYRNMPTLTLYHNKKIDNNGRDW